MRRWANELVPNASEATVHQVHVLLDRSSAGEASSLLSATALQRAGSQQVRLHEQVPASGSIRLVVVVLQRLHAQQLPAEDSKSADDAEHATIASTNGTIAATSDADAVQELQVERDEATDEDGDPADPREERRRSEIQHCELWRVHIKECAEHQLIIVFIELKLEPASRQQV